MAYNINGKDYAEIQSYKTKTLATKGSTIWKRKGWLTKIMRRGDRYVLIGRGK